jgi:hypothetical protein
MFKKLKLRIAICRLKIAEDRARRAENCDAAGKKSSKFWARAKKIIKWPFVKIAELANRLWEWLCRLNIIAMVNLGILVGIIALFSVLISNVLDWGGNDIRRGSVRDDTPRLVSVRTMKIGGPQSKQYKTARVRGHFVRQTKSQNIILPISDKAPMDIATAVQKTPRHGDIIIDMDSRKSIKSGDDIRGNVYVQYMRKYTLPCDIIIEGDLFLRDVELVKFCGGFTITGNIYVSKRSSFGPIPRNARLGGQVIF